MYTENDLVRIAKRENNTKRSYLVVDPVQGKHVPVSPTDSLKLFSDLAAVVKEKYKTEKLLVVGFAETATAIGAKVAIELKADYMQTTREILPDVEYLFFSEEHSHATEQKLVKDDFDMVINSVDRVLFVEDEVTTGKTILNIITLMQKKYTKSLKFAVLSILNGMGQEYISVYEANQIDLNFLVKTDHSKYTDIADKYKSDGQYVECNPKPIEYKEYIVNGYLNSRRLVNSEKYLKACENLWKNIDETVKGNYGKNVLVVGTEEMMFPALYVGEQIENKFSNEKIRVRSHSTTRSPIAVSSKEDYPLHTRYELISLFDSERKTFIYDIDTYDLVLIVTDANDECNSGIYSLINAVGTKNKNIILFRWCEK